MVTRAPARTIVRESAKPELCGSMTTTWGQALTRAGSYAASQQATELVLALLRQPTGESARCEVQVLRREPQADQGVAPAAREQRAPGERAVLVGQAPLVVVRAAAEVGA